MTNYVNDIPKWLSQHYHLNFDAIVKDIERLGPIRFKWEGIMHDEQFIQTAKKECVIKNGNFGEILMRKTHLKIMLKYLSSNNANNEDDKHNSKNYEFKIKRFCRTN